MDVKFIKKKRFLLDFIYQNERKNLKKLGILNIISSQGN